MNFTITLGWWLLPTIITLVVFGRLAAYCITRKSGSDYDFGLDILVFFGMAAAVSLGSWVGYLAVRLLTS